MPLAASFAVFSVLVSLPLSAAEVALNGRVVDEDEAPVHDARVSVHSTSAVTAASPGPWQALTDPTGLFMISLPEPGDYLVDVEHEGYYALKDRPVHVEAGQELILSIASVREVFQSENVRAETSPLELAASQNRETLSGTEINDIPYANSHSLRNALPLMPNVLQEGNGTLHVNGASENQVLYLLNGFNLTDPITGGFQTLLAVEGIRSTDLMSSRYSPEYGKGTSGVLAINTEGGTDKFHYTATDFIPGISIQQGLRLSNWYPRVGISGPIVKGKAWFSDTFDSEYTQSLVTGLPSGENTRSGWAGSNLLHTQVNLTPSNNLFVDFLVNVNNQGRVGLGPLNPVSATENVHSHQYFASVKDQVYFGHGVLVDFGYAHNDYSINQTPQGPNLYVLTPQGNTGNYFLNSRQGATRDEGLVHAYLPRFRFAGSHQIEIGGDGDYLRYNAGFNRTGYQVIGLNNQLISETLFPTPANFHLSDAEMSSYVLDTWSVSKTFQLLLGIRQDWDRSIGDVAWSPRLSFSWSPFEAAHTRISGGFAITRDAVTLDMLGRPYDQVAYTTTYNPDGTPAGPPAPTSFAFGNASLVLPHARNWNLEIDHQFQKHINLTAKYLRRRAMDGFLFLNTFAPNAPPSLLPLPNVDQAGVFQLTNLRRDDYDAVQVSVRQVLSGQYEWMAAYIHSRTLSNAVLDPNTPQPLQVLPDFVPTPWDAPNHFLAWTYLPLPWKNWAVSALANMRTGFPFSVRQENGLVVGAVDSYRYPLNFDLNLAIEWIVTLRGYRFALRGGINNITNSRNPTAVNNVVGAPQFLQFYGDEGRHFVVRIRFFGRAQGK